jgi:prepilin-type processing-associated H-X9-DG protein
VHVLQRYYQTPLLLRSPGDDSPHWPGGTPGGHDGDAFRVTSYGLNSFLDPVLTPAPDKLHKITQVRASAEIVHFAILAETGPQAFTDHIDAEHIGEGGEAEVPVHAAEQIATNLFGGPRPGWDGRSNYAFLDGHVETLLLRDAYRSATDNRFDPRLK